MRYLLIAPLLLFASCEPKKVQEQTLRLNLAEDPVSFDPRLVRSLKDLTVVKQLYEGLMRLDAIGKPQPGLARAVEISEDGLIYTFHLRQSVWTNGDPITAHDFVTSWQKVLDPSFAADYSHMLYPIKNGKHARLGECLPQKIGVHALDDYTLIVELEAPTPYFLELTAFPTYFPTHQHTLTFNGPFQLKRWSPQSELILEKNPCYWDQKSVRLQAIQFSLLADNNTESKLFEKSDLDWLGQPISHNLSTDLISKVAHQSFAVAGTFWLKFNTHSSPFDQQKIRKAFSYALNRKEIIEHILQGNQTLATGPLPPAMQLQKEPYFQDGDATRAKQLFKEVLKENGWTNDNFPRITLNYPPSERNSKIVQLIQQQWEKVFQIPIRLEASEGQYYKRKLREGCYQVATGDWIADYNDPLAFLELFKSQNEMNETGWDNACYDLLLDQSIAERDSEKRMDLLHEAEKILVESMPIAPLYHYAFDYLKKDYVKEVILSPLGIADFKWTKIER